MRGRVRNYDSGSGVYMRKSIVNMVLPNGKAFTVNPDNLRAINPEEFIRRWNEYNVWVQSLPEGEGVFERSKRNYLRDLPDTPFWEGDVVKQLPIEGNERTWVVCGIDWWNEPYYSLAETIEDFSGRRSYANDLVLVSKGMVFSSLREKAILFQLMGRARLVRNPSRNDKMLYRWTRQEIKDSIKKGLIHGFTRESGLLGELEDQNGVWQ
ncbi:hypothetical protein COT44_02245 [Candidatus Shapirobacteria bacterium CG08_land_8_20_14_0_20_39_18]|uniref:Uncharacterized protein n=1 Tax=Candidatus Shapirobacteria bacterium CG08_land_8_20_14_0_20_39_18 TaxID=1974883 RepID=A0A2M6XD39_9BACT|nr:MAG: hypothetical protein COT44_02245 [Candidatus Shapirobacteria bacterium CG08_land_8_20_14_0_20_39_18]PIY66131.1 MAG: hypothetical protein COY91_01515 [Candidatus Shapirobacteria bacterium CG_4_10_14_0_8_um_filter_39_15]PJE68518.1 MAG: hypothetical protein COU94_01485 [Candidatus Shapirobacteria bacterium CG10_big_fil_rev_8_21_14_0_10_38_8]